MKQYALMPFFLAVFSSSAIQAEVTVTDLGTTTPTIGANDTGVTTDTNSRFSFDVDPDDVFTQTFTVPTAGKIDSIFLGYNAFLDTNSMTLDLNVNGTDFTGIVLDGADFSGSDGGNTSGFYWMKFDLSAENVLAVTGPAANSFTMDATASVEGSQGYAFAPRQHFFNGNQYAGGALSATFNVNGDVAFVVKMAPVSEPSSPALSGFTFDQLTGDSEVSIKGEPDTAYILTEADDLDFAIPDQSPVPLTGVTVGSLNGDQVTTDTNGIAIVQFNLGTSKPVTFIRAETP